MRTLTRGRRAALLLATAVTSAVPLLAGAAGTPVAAATVPDKPTCLVHVNPTSTPDCAVTVFVPSGAVKGAMIIVAAGGWASSADNTAKDGAFGPSGRWWASQGWRTYLVQQTSGAVADGPKTTPQKVETGHGPDGVADVDAWYDRIRAQTPADQPVCAYGQSSAGNTALLLMSDRPGTKTQQGLDCVVTEAAPTDLTALPAGHAQDVAKQAFGSRLGGFSPALRPVADYTGRRILMGQMAGDLVVPVNQMNRFFASKEWGKLEKFPALKNDGGACDTYDDLDVAHQFAHRCSWPRGATDPTTAPPKDITAKSLQDWKDEMVRFTDVVVKEHTA